MTAHEGALLALAGSLDELAVPYAVIGGLANAVWGEPRSTLDIDVTVHVEEARLNGVIDELMARFQSATTQPHAFVARSSVLPLRSSDGVPIDVVFARVPFEEDLVRRAVTLDIAGAPVRFCSAEDLILMKIISDRPRDQEDAHRVVRRRMRELDLNYLEPRIRELAGLLEMPEVMARWTAWTQEAPSGD